MVTKSIVQTLSDHRNICYLAREKGVLVAMEVHKRLDPFYADARDRARAGLGFFQYMYSYMSQQNYTFSIGVSGCYTALPVPFG